MKFAVFFIIALGVVFLLYWTVIGRMFSYFELRRAWLLSITVILITFLALFLQGKYNTYTTYQLQTAMMVVLGIVWVSTTVVISSELLRVLMPSLQKNVLGLIALSAVAILVGISLIIANTWQVNEYTIRSDKIESPIKIVQIADLHIQGIDGNQRYQKILSKAVAQKPDIILMPGDIIDPGLPDKLSYDTSIPLIASLGNHEFYAGDAYSEEYLKRSNITVLRGSSVELSGIRIIGVDDHAPISSVNSAINSSKQKSDDNIEKYSILLYHSPHEVEKIKGADLVLSGHTHAGQLFPFNLLVPLQFRYIHGWYDLANTKLHVTSGAGTWGPPMRLGSRNEIVVINLVPAKTNI